MTDLTKLTQLYERIVHLWRITIQQSQISAKRMETQKKHPPKKSNYRRISKFKKHNRATGKTAKTAQPPKR